MTIHITPKNLRAAADLLESQPKLVQQDYYAYVLDPNAPSGERLCFCTMGAIAEVKRVDPETIYDPGCGDEAVEFLPAPFRKAALKVYPKGESTGVSLSESQRAFEAITTWNDKGARRPKTAADRLRKVADLIETS